MNPDHKHSIASMPSLIEQMVEQQVRTWEVFDEDVLEIMQTIPREKFLPEKLAKFAYADSQFRLDDNFVLPSPSVQGKLLQALDLDSQDSVLQVGLGSGYLTACLAELSAHVHVVDSHEESLHNALELLTSLDINNVSSVNHPIHTVFDVIEKQYDAVVLQHALNAIPHNLKTSLKPGGRAVLFTGDAPVMTCVRIERISDTEWTQEDLFETELAPLNIYKQEKVTFSF